MSWVPAPGDEPAADRTPGRSLVFATDALEPLGDLARAAERAGFQRVWTTEYPGRDAMARALAIALSTTRIGVGTGIAYAFTRAPLAMASLAADIQRLARGRFVLGLGAGTRGVRRWYDVDFEPPAPRLAEYVDRLRDAWEAMPASGPGGVPVMAAGLQPTMVRTVARTCDGVLFHPLALVRTHLRERVVPALRRAAQERGASVPVAAWCIASVDDDSAQARDRVRRQLAFYLSTPSYGSVVSGTEWEPVAGAVREAFDSSGRAAPWHKLAALIPDSMVDEVAVAGTPAETRIRAAELERELVNVGVTELVFQTVGADVTESEVIGNCQRIIATLGPDAQLVATSVKADHLSTAQVR